MEAIDPARTRTHETWLAVAVVAFAVALRAWHVAWGLPDFTEEAVPLHLALDMRSFVTGRIDPNPHAFHYPSLGIYLHFLVQQFVYAFGRVMGRWSSPADFRLAFDLDPTPMVLAARALGIACDAFAVLAAWRIGRRHSPVAGLVAALLVTLAGSAIATARSIYVDSLLMALALWALERMLAWHAKGGRVRFASAAVLIGLAAGAKYPGATLLIPFAWLACARAGRRGVALALLAGAIAALVFLVTTPYALLDPHHFLADLGFEGRHAAEEHFGSVGHRSFGFHLAGLVRDLGWPALLALGIAPFVAWRERALRHPLVALGLALFVFGVPIALARIDAERYRLPVIAAIAPLAGIAVATLLAQAPARGRGAFVGATVILLVAFPLAEGLRVARAGAGNTQVEARRWCEAHVPADRLIVTEGYGPRLLDGQKIAEAREGALVRLASPAWRARFEALRPMNVISLPLGVAGRLTNELALAGLPPVTLEVAPEMSSINRVFYDPALFAATDYVVTTSAVRGRYTADPTRFAAECRLYRALDRHARIVARFTPGGGIDGPEIVVYAIDAGARAALAGPRGLDPLWWTAAIPAPYRRQATELLAAEREVRDSLLSLPAAPPRRAAAGAFVTAPRLLAAPVLPAPAPVGDAPATPVPGPRDADGDAAPWVRSLRPLYQMHVANFAAGMARSLALLGRYDAASQFAEANLVMMPEDVPSCLLASVSLARTGRWLAARATIERTLEVLDPQRVDPTLTLEYARVLAHTGDAARAATLDRALLERLAAADPIARAARADLARAAN